MNRNNNARVTQNSPTRLTSPNANHKMSPKAVMLRTGIKTVSTASQNKWFNNKQTVSSAKQFSNHAQTVKRHFYQKTAMANQKWVPKINQAVPTARPANPTARHLNVKGKRGNAVKASAHWVKNSTKPNGASKTSNKFSHLDAQGRSKPVMVWIPKSN